MIFILFLLLFGHSQSRELRNRYLLNESTLSELDSWEMNLLKDFVRRRGQASVERVKINENEEDTHGGNDKKLIDIDAMMKSGGTFLTASNILAPPSFISPDSSIIVSQNKKSVLAPTKNRANSRLIEMGERKDFQKKKKKTKVPEKTPREVDEETLEEYANMVQAMVSRRKSQLTPSTTIHSSSIPSIHPHLITSSRIIPSSSSIKQLNVKKIETIPQSQITSPIGKWQSMNPEEDEDDKEYQEVQEDQDDDDSLIIKSEFTKEEWETKTKKLSEELSSLLYKFKKLKTNSSEEKKTPIKIKGNQPKVTIIREGSAKQLDDGQYEFIATLTLIEDDDKRILVDTGLGTDINARTHLLNQLGSLNIAPPSISIVITTHGHSDHSGNLHDFPDSVHYQGFFAHHHAKFNLTNLFQGNRQELTPSVYLEKTPGHTSDDISVFIQGEQKMGNVVVAGDIFIRGEDVDHPMMWRPLSSSEEIQMTSRRRIACSSDWIIPGHGPPFQLTKQQKKELFNC